MVAIKQSEQIDAVINAFCAAFGIQRSELLSRRRIDEVVECRFAVYEYLHREAGLSYNSIGKAMGRDHAAVIFGVQGFQRLVKMPRFFRLYEAGMALCGDTIPEAPHVKTLLERMADLERRIKDLEQASTNN